MAVTFFHLLYDYHQVANNHNKEFKTEMYNNILN
jgi:hypothetical protein